MLPAPGRRHAASPPDGHDHDRGLQFDLGRLVDRRRALGLFAGVGLAGLAACTSTESSAGTVAANDTGDVAGSTSSTATSGSSTAGTVATTSSIAATAGTTDELIPKETAGPYPADGSNGVNVLKESGVVRSDIVSSFGTASGVAAGVPLTVELTVIDVAGGTGPRPGAAVYLWHCDQDGNYSMYSKATVDENYLRGVQECGRDGTVRFTSIFPGAYSGRWPHIHFEVYPSLADATAAGKKLVTSQLALPENTCDLVYATDGYRQSVTNMARSSLANDNVFRDGYSSQLATTTGSVDDGFVARLNVGV